MRFKGEDEIGVDIHTFGFSLDPLIHGLMFIIMIQESQTNILGKSYRREELLYICFWMSFAYMYTSQDKTLALEGVLCQFSQR